MVAYIYIYIYIYIFRHIYPDIMSHDIPNVDVLYWGVGFNDTVMAMLGNGL